MHKNYLSQIATVQLGKMLEKDYPASKLADAKFAEMASARLGCNITESNVFSLRRAMKIPSNRPLNTGATIVERITAVEQFLDKLEPKWREQA